MSLALIETFPALGNLKNSTSIISVTPLKYLEYAYACSFWFIKKTRIQY